MAAALWGGGAAISSYTGCHMCTLVHVVPASNQMTWQPLAWNNWQMISGLNPQHLLAMDFLVALADARVSLAHRASRGVGPGLPPPPTLLQVGSYFSLSSQSPSMWLGHSGELTTPSSFECLPWGLGLQHWQQE